MRNPQSSLSSETLVSRLDNLTQWYTDTNPKSAQEAKEAIEVLPGGNTRTVLHQSPFPLVIDHGRGATVTSKDGTEYIDFISEFSAAMFGHSHPKIHDAIHEAMSIGINLGNVIGKEAEFGKLIQDRFPSMELMRFANSGTEANTIALAAALAYTGRKEVLVFANGYHGSTLVFPKGRGTPLNLPHQFIISPYNDIEATKALLHPGIGTILVEPLQSAGGIIPASKEFLQFLREAASSLDAVLIFDEVVTSRFDYHGMQGYHNVIPDMTVLGKYVGGGFSFGCFGGKREIMKQFDPNAPNHLAHSGTYNNNVFTMTAGIAGMKLVTPKEIARINALGDRTRAKFSECIRKRGLEVEVVGFGSAVGLSFFGSSGDILRDIFYYELMKRGILMARRGFFMFNLMHTDVHVDQLLQVFSEIVNLVPQT
ncbi:PLP-dependent transferase [Corynespora cassiicola Philippines]|uniref:PLP-dependent transferase n=1 Tax=Corynespora cassiicola Philippines TaxID=1448308 RepID=A0A2T2NCU1_CORCC|nr:PLP-dependent transferase [Corynespora cassiicola Philippines]